MNNRTQPIFNRKPKPQQDHDAYLHAASTAKVPVSVYFLDGEAIPFATIKQVSMFTILLSVEGVGDVLAYKNALKKIATAE